MKKSLLVKIAIILTLMLIISGCDIIKLPADNSPSKLPTETKVPDVAFDEWRIMAAENLPEYIPINVVMGSAEYSSPTLSPDGSKIMYRHINGSGDNIKIMDLFTGETQNVAWPPEPQGIPYFMWAQDSETVLLMIDHMGDENYGIYTSNIKTGDTKQLFDEPESSAMIMSMGPTDSEIYIATNERDKTVFDIYLLDFMDLTKEIILLNPGYITSWMFDFNNELHIIEGIADEQGGKAYYYAKGDIADDEGNIIDDSLSLLKYYPYEYTYNSYCIGFSPKNDKVYFSDSLKTDTSVLIEYDLLENTDKILTTEIGYDIGSVWLDLEKNEATAYSYVGSKNINVDLNSEMEGHFDNLEAISDGEFMIIDSSSDDKIWLVAYFSDTDDTSYYIYNMMTLKSEYLFHSDPQLLNYTFAPMEPMEFTASDGLNIEGYITFPVGLKRKDLPLVLMVHGGPWARDFWGFNPEVQWLANRGYVVMQVNFRGSTGFGSEFTLAGDGEWAGAMQQDLLDAVKWAVEKGYAHEDRVAIYGASYGGYAALVGATQSSDIFACAVDMFGPSSLITLVNNMPAYWESERDALYRSIGNPEMDRELMEEKSPLYQADEIEIPLLIVQGGRDVRVTDIEAQQMVDAIEDAGLEVEYMYFPDAGHGFTSFSQRDEFYTVCEEFLAEYLGGISPDSTEK